MSEGGILFLVETESQVEDFLRRAKGHSARWIALSPSAAWALSEKGIPHLLLDQFCDRTELERECWEGFAMLADSISKLDTTLVSQNTFLQEWDIYPFFLHLWQLSLCLDGLIFRKHVLERVRRSFPREKLVAHLAICEEWGGFGINFSPKETLWGRVLKAWGDERVELLPWENVLSRKNLSMTQKVKREARRSLFFQSLLQSFRWKLWKNMEYFFVGGSFRKEAFVLLGGHSEWRAIASDLISQGNQLFFLTSLSQPGHLNYIERTRERWIMNCLRLPLPTRIVELLLDRISFIFRCAPHCALEWIQQLDMVFPKHARALLSGPRPEFWKGVVVAFCRQKKIPVYSFQHGSEWVVKGRITQKQDLFTLPGSTAHFVFGKGVKRGYERSPYLGKETKVVSVGMPFLQQLRGLDPQKKKIHLLWPFGGYYGNGWYCNFSPPQLDIQAFSEQLVIVEGLIQLLKEQPDFFVTVKLYSSTYCEESPPWIKKFQDIERVRVVKNPSFRDLLKDQSALLLDSPTTTLLEGAATRLPLFVLTSVFSWGEEANDLLRKRACLANSASELVESLREFVLYQKYSADVEDMSFLREYGLAHDNAKEGVIDFILDRNRFAFYKGEVSG